MLRKVIKIDKEKCNGCGACATACHEGDYADKLTEIITNNDIKSVKIVRMEVPCCSGIVNAAKKALRASGKFIPRQVVTVTTDGKILE